MNNSNFNITKKSGEVIRFDIEKIKHSFERSGANQEDIDSVLSQLSERIYDGISTKKLFRIAYNLLRKKSVDVAGRYRLKNAIMELGPSGFPFEHYVAELMKYQGFNTTVGSIIQGKCVTHEVDVVAEKDGQKIMIECKYHGNTNNKSDVKVALYIHSRYNDVLRTWTKEDPKKKYKYQGMIVTNTRFTEDAVNYARCEGMQLISWDYPSKGSLRERIDISGLHPITVLQSITKHEKQVLLNKSLVLCRSLTAENLNAAGIIGNRAKKVIREAHGLIRPR